MSWRVTLSGTWRWLSKLRTAPILLLLLLVVFVAFRGVLLQPGLVLPFNDGSIETALSPTYRLPDIIPQYWDNQFFFGQGNGVLCPTTTQWLEIVFFGPHTYRREGTMLGVWCIATVHAARPSGDGALRRVFSGKFRRFIGRTGKRGEIPCQPRSLAWATSPVIRRAGSPPAHYTQEGRRS